MKEEKTLTIEDLKAKYKALGEEIAQKEKEEAEAREAKLIAEKAARKEEVDSAEKNYRRLLGAYIKDYGSYSAAKSYSTDSEPTPYLWHMFF